MGNQNNQSATELKRKQQSGQADEQSAKRNQQDGQPGRQIDDNQDDLGRDVNDPSKTSNEINKKA
jgi:hypothetical protein